MEESNTVYNTSKYLSVLFVRLYIHFSHSAYRDNTLPLRHCTASLFPPFDFHVHVPQGLDSLHVNAWCLIHHGEDDCTLCHQGLRCSRPGARSQCRSVRECRIEDLLWCTALPHRAIVRRKHSSRHTLADTCTQRNSGRRERNSLLPPSRSHSRRLLRHSANGRGPIHEFPEAIAGRWTPFTSRRPVFFRSGSIHALCCAEIRSPLPVLQHCYTTNVRTRG